MPARQITPKIYCIVGLVSSALAAKHIFYCLTFKWKLLKAVLILNNCKTQHATNTSYQETNKPIAQATELHGAGECSLHTLALLVGDVELLVLDEELGAGRLAGLNTGIGLVAHASEAESVLEEEGFWNIVDYF